MRSWTLALVIGFAVTFGDPLDAATPKTYWEHFRSSAPLLTQDIVVSEISKMGEAIVVLAEPPAALFTSRSSILHKIFGKYLVESEIFRYPLGVDGWVQDIVFALKDVDQVTLDQRISQLHEALYGTDYKASFRAFEPRPWDTDRFPTRRLAPPNLRINAASLHDWLVANPIGLIDVTVDADAPSEDPEGTTLSAVFATKRTGVFFSEAPGLVLLAVDRSERLNAVRARLRQFAVETDALLGAVVRDDSDLLVLVGRERTTPVDHMEPLRIETILMLAASETTDLAQSYERRAPFAGRVIDGDIPKAETIFARVHPIMELDAMISGAQGVDWAPILLSRDLTHTEYGQLLNITDQMLKGWSMANTVAYANFDYQAPLDYPESIDIYSSIQNDVGGQLTQLTFNWNTAGYGSWSAFGPYQVFALQQTGALPISYIPDSADFKVTEDIERLFIDKENRYGEFFANLRDPYLNRVAQYAALHVIFRTYPVEAEREDPAVSEEAYAARWNGLRGQVLLALDRLTELTDQDPESVIFPLLADDEPGGCNIGFVELAEPWEANAVRLASIAYAHSERQSLDRLALGMVDARALQAALGDKVAGQIDRYDRLIDESNVRGVELQQVYDHCLGDGDPEQCNFDRLLQLDEAIVADDEQLDRLGQEIELAYGTLDPILDDAQELMQIVKLFAPCSEAWRAVVDGNPEPAPGAYKTPSIVVSLPTTELGFSGGHNLDGRAVRVVGDDAVPLGTFRLADDGNAIYLHPKDMSKASAVAREYERFRLKYTYGDDAYRSRSEQRIQALLEAAPGEPAPFHAAILGRPNAPVAFRGLGPDAASGRHFIGERQVTLTAVEAEAANAYAQATGAQAVVSRQFGTYRVIYPNGRPPYAIESGSPANFQRNLQSLVESQARAQAAEVVIVSDGTLGVAELQGVQLSVQARQAVAQAGGGGSGLKPPANGKLGMAFGGEPPRRGPGPLRLGPGGNERVLAFFPASRQAHRVLKRQDVDWQKATVDATELKSVGHQAGRVVAVMRIPSTSAKPNLFARFTAIFKRRQPEQTDLNALVETATAQTQSVLLDATVQSRVAAIRDAYLSKMGEDVEFRILLHEDRFDFLVVEREGDGHGRMASAG